MKPAFFHFHLSVDPYGAGHAPKGVVMAACHCLAEYGVIAQALEDGSFAKLRSCNECQKFFIAKDLRQKYCTSHCRNIADRKGAPERVRKMRKRQELLKSEWMRSIAIPRTVINAPQIKKPPNKFMDFFTIATKPKHTAAEVSKMKPYVKELARGVQGWNIIAKWKNKSPDQVWEELSFDRKRIFGSNG